MSGSGPIASFWSGCGWTNSQLPFERNVTDQEAREGGAAELWYYWADKLEIIAQEWTNSKPPLEKMYQ